jgi:hypothetical protein
MPFTPPALNAVNFALTIHSVPALNAVNFELGTPAGGGGIKSVAGVAFASIKVISGVAVASVKKVSGVSASVFMFIYRSLKMRIKALKSMLKYLYASEVNQLRQIQ